ncbi:MAG: tetratricopeptide repeat protein [Desulfomonilaceae bacterium]
MAEKKLTRKELLKEPDEFLTITGKAIEYTRNYPKVVAAGIALVVIILLAVGGVYYYYKNREAKSHELLEQVWREYEVAVQSPHKPTPQKLDELFAEFNALARQYRSLPAGEIALLYSGNVLYEKGDFKGALGRYEAMQSTNLVKSGFGPLVLYHIAMCRFQLKEYDRAVMSFDQLSKDINSPYRREAYGTIARIYELMGKNKEAIQAYRQYLKIFPEAPDAAFVRAKIAEIAAKA